MDDSAAAAVVRPATASPSRRSARRCWPPPAAVGRRYDALSTGARREDHLTAATIPPSADRQERVSLLLPPSEHDCDKVNGDAMSSNIVKSILTIKVRGQPLHKRSVRASGEDTQTALAEESSDIRD